MASRVPVLVLVGILLVTAGCTGTDSVTSTTTGTQTETHTPTPTPTETNAGSESSSTNQQSEAISVREGSSSGSVLVAVRANTSLEASDPEGDNPGEPYFVIEVDGEKVRETQEVRRSTLENYTFTIDASNLQTASETVSVTVVLMDRDSVFDDEIRSWSTTVDSIATPTESSSTETEADHSSTSSRTEGTTPPSATTTDARSTTTVSTTRTTTSTVTPTTETTETTKTTETTEPTETTETTETTERSSGQSTRTVTIVEIIDGDTAEIQYQNGSTETIRLLGVDTPEVHTENNPSEFENVPDTEAGANCLRDWGHKASEFARTELLGERVTITFDENEGRRGSYDRLLVYVHHDGELFNYQLVAQGYARMYDSDFTKRSQFASAESSAQQGNGGLWECTSVQSTTTETTTASSSGGAGQLSVAQIHADAPENDHDNLNEEYIVFENTGDETLDLSGWRLSDEVDHTFSFPNGFTLDPGETVTVYTGSGSNTNSELYWGSGRAVWNNGGDTIIVTDANGNVVIREEYSG